MLYDMARITLDLPDDVIAEIRREAALHSQTEAEVVCSLVRGGQAPIDREPAADPSPPRRVLPFDHLVNSKDELPPEEAGRLSEIMDEILSKEWADAITGGS